MLPHNRLYRRMCYFAKYRCTFFLIRIFCFFFFFISFALALARLALYSFTCNILNCKLFSRWNKEEEKSCNNLNFPLILYSRLVLWHSSFGINFVFDFCSSLLAYVSICWVLFLKWFLSNFLQICYDYIQSNRKPFK